MSAAVLCSYCERPAHLVTGAELYPHRPDLALRYFYRCEQCDAQVGCHPGSTRPLGSLANVALRKARMAAHAEFDALWKSGSLKRSHAYAWLASELGLHVNDTHIGSFDESTCRKVVEACRNRKPQTTGGA